MQGFSADSLTIGVIKSQKKNMETQGFMIKFTSQVTVIICFFITIKSFSAVINVGFLVSLFRSTLIYNSISNPYSVKITLTCVSLWMLLVCFNPFFSIKISLYLELLKVKTARLYLPTISFL